MSAAPRYALRDLVGLPSLLSLARLPLGVAAVVSLDRPWVALALLGAAGATDVLDGWVARRFHCTTDTGALLDAVMDKVVVGLLAVALVVSQRLTLVELLLLGIRDIGEIVIGAKLAAAHASRRSPKPNVFGKLATLLQYGVLASAVVARPALPAMVSAAGVTGALAALQYWRQEERRGAR